MFYVRHDALAAPASHIRVVRSSHFITSFLSHFCRKTSPEFAVSKKWGLIKTDGPGPKSLLHSPSTACLQYLFDFWPLSCFVIPGPLDPKPVKRRFKLQYNCRGGYKLLSGIGYVVMVMSCRRIYRGCRRPSRWRGFRCRACLF
jgi:hypothetical protein